MLVKRKLRIADCGLRIRNRRARVPNPKSEIRNPKSPHRGLSLTEVLISMGILTLGLLGVASVFPVGSFYMQKAEISDKGSAIAQSVMNEIMTRGMLNPRAWFVMIPNGGPAVYNVPFTADGSQSPDGKVDGTFTRPLIGALKEALSETDAWKDKTILLRQFGSAYVLDPLGVSVMAARSAKIPIPAAQHGPAAVFPAAAYNGFLYHANFPAWNTSTWAAWCGGSSGTYSGYEWPIRRVTFRQPSNGWHMDPTVAEHFFRGNDDLTVDFPPRDDRPGIQNWDTTTTTAGSTVPLARKWTGDYSWIVTVAPPTNAARDGMATNPEGFAYDISVVVFYKRAFPENADTNFAAYQAIGGVYQSAMNQNERAVKANVVSTGLNGGELLLTDYDDYRDAKNALQRNAFDNLKTSNWIMLCGPHPNSSVSEPRFVLKWYQVVANDRPTSATLGYDAAKNQRVVTLRGPEWPWQPSTVSTSASNDLCVAICKGAVAVHTKSMRLESGLNDATFNSAGGSSGTSGGTQYPWH